jgi:hypothetical protein
LCSTAARERADPLTATAVTTRRWLLIEHPGPWAFDAFGGSGIDAGVRAELAGAVQGTGTRLLLIRRPGRIHRTWPRSWALVDATEGVPTRWGTWHRDADLMDVAGELGGDNASRSALDSTSTASAVKESADPLLLVCTHGRHDTCCAVRGRPVAATLAERWPAQTWECSHVGGDRFAANVLVLPDGAYYGDVEPDEVVDVVSAHFAGAMSVRHLRGLSSQPPVVQAAVSAVLERFGPAGPRDARATGVTRLGDNAWRVELACTGPLPATVTATVARSQRASALLTCQARQPSTSWQWAVSELRAG